MPLHDWSRIPAGLFHDFHQTWAIEIKRALNSGILPKGLSAFVEQRSGPRESTVLAIESLARGRSELGKDGGVATLEPPTTQFATRANRIVVKHGLGRTVAVIEIVSPGNKDSRGALRDFVEKAIDFLRAGIHVLVIDVFPPTPRDPFGIHKAILDEVEEKEFTFPDGKDRILASYEAGEGLAYYVEAIGIGDILPPMQGWIGYSNYSRLPVPPRFWFYTWDLQRRAAFCPS